MSALAVFLFFAISLFYLGRYLSKKKEVYKETDKPVSESEEDTLQAPHDEPEKAVNLADPSESAKPVMPTRSVELTKPLESKPVVLSEPEEPAKPVGTTRSVEPSSKSLEPKPVGPHSNWSQQPTGQLHSSRKWQLKKMCHLVRLP